MLRSLNLFEQLVVSILGSPTSEVTPIPVLEKSTATQETLPSVQLCSVVSINSPSHQSSRNFGFCLSATQAIGLRTDQQQLPIT